MYKVNTSPNFLLVLKTDLHYIIHETDLRYIIHEGREWLHSLISQVLKFYHHFFFELIINDRHRKRTSLIGKEVSIICTLQVEFQV